MNTDFERKTYIDEDSTKYYYPKENLGAYDSIVSNSKTKDVENYYEYVDGLNNNLKKAYYTALARERYGMYKVDRNEEEVFKNLGLK